jgi:hypothetical protein
MGLYSCYISTHGPYIPTHTGVAAPRLLLGGGIGEKAGVSLSDEIGVIGTNVKIFKINSRSTMQGNPSGEKSKGSPSGLSG